MADTVFGKIVRGEVPCHKVYEDDKVLAFLDINPLSHGHTLVVPFREVATWFDASADEKKAILDLVEVVKRKLDEEFRPQGYNVGFNAGAAAGQTVMHLHVHVIGGPEPLGRMLPK